MGWTHTISNAEGLSQLVMGQGPQYLSIKSILLKFSDDTLQPPPQLSIHNEGKLKIVKTNPNFEEITNLYSIFFVSNSFCFMRFTSCK